MSADTRGPVTTVSSTVGTSATVALTANGSRNFFQIQCTHATNTLQYTMDGSTPVMNGQGSYLAAAGGSATYSSFIPTGPITVIGSGAGTTFTINWM